MFVLMENTAGCYVDDEDEGGHDQGGSPAHGVHAFKGRIGGVFGDEHRRAGGGTGEEILRPGVGKQGGEEQPVGDVTTNAGVEIKEGVAYLMSMNQVTNGHTVYVCGGIDQDRYLVTSTDKAAALQIFVEKTDAGYKFYTTIDGAKKYINVTTNDAGKTAVLYQDTCTSVYKYVSETNIWVTTLDGQDKYLGSYQTFDTISASNTSYINAGNTGVSQFPLELIVAE